MATAVSTSQINLSWSAPTNNGGLAITNYKIYRGTTTCGETLIDTVASNVYTYNNSSLNSDTNYCYKVTAVNANGEGAQSEERSALTLLGGIDGNTSLLIHGNGTENSTSFSDSSSFAHTLYRYGDTKVATAATAKFSQAAYFDGSGDYLLASDTNDLRFTTVNYTVDLWFYKTRLKNYDPEGAEGFFGKYAEGVYTGIVAHMYTYAGATHLIVSDRSGIASYIDAIVTIPLNQWNHLAVVRNGSTIRAYLNGATVGTMTAQTSGDSTGNFVIGTSTSWGTYTVPSGSWHMTSNDLWSFCGYIDEFRISKGVARWTTASFTPPSQPYSN